MVVGALLAAPWQPREPPVQQSQWQGRREGYPSQSVVAAVSLRLRPRPGQNSEAVEAVEAVRVSAPPLASGRRECASHGRAHRRRLPAQARAAYALARGWYVNSLLASRVQP
jgi:hypothetical protein